MRGVLVFACRAFPPEHRARQSEEVVDTAAPRGGRVRVARGARGVLARRRRAGPAATRRVRSLGQRRCGAACRSARARQSRSCAGGDHCRLPRRHDVLLSRHELRPSVRRRLVVDRLRPRRCSSRRRPRLRLAQTRGRRGSRESRARRLRRDLPGERQSRTTARATSTSSRTRRRRASRPGGSGSWRRPCSRSRRPRRGRVGSRSRDCLLRLSSYRRSSCSRARHGACSSTCAGRWWRSYCSRSRSELSRRGSRCSASASRSQPRRASIGYLTAPNLQHDPVVTGSRRGRRSPSASSCRSRS